MRNDKYILLQDIMQETVEEKKGIGRKKISWNRNIREWAGMIVEELFHVARNRDAFRNVVANLQ